MKALKFTIPLLLVATPLLAQQKPTVDIYGTSQIPVEAPKVGASVSLVSAEELENLGVKHVSDALRLLPSVQVSQSGGQAGLTYVRLRGGASRHTLVLIDGIVMNDFGDGAANLAQLNVSDIERIEVIRGAQSGIHGAQAHSGVISITTKSGKGYKKPEIEAGLEYGSLNTQNAYLSARGQKDNMHGAIHVFGGRSTSYNYAFNGSEKDGYSNYGVSTRFGAQLSPNLNVEAIFRHTQRYEKYDTNWGVLADGDERGVNRNTSGKALLHYRPSAAFSHLLSVDMHDSSRADAGSYFSTSLGRTVNGKYQGQYNFDGLGSKNRLIYGLQSRQENYKFDGGAMFGQTRSQNSLFGEYLMDFTTGTSLSAALRQDFNSHYEKHLTYRVTASQQVTPLNGRLHGSMGKAVNIPTFVDIFGYPLWWIDGNANLKPETSNSFDVGYEQKWFNGLLITDATVFYKRLSNEFINVNTPAFTTRRENATGTTHRQGLELSFTALPTHWLRINGHYTYITGVQSDNLSPLRVPRNAFALSATAKFMQDKASATLAINHNGAMPDNDFSTWPATRVMLKSYTKLTANLTYAFNKNVTGYIRADNLLNQKYQEVFSYRAPPLEVFAGIKVRLD